MFTKSLVFNLDKLFWTRQKKRCSQLQRTEILNGRKSSASIECFLLYSSCFLVMTLGLFLLGLSVWSMARKLYLYNHLMEIRLDTTFFSIPAAAMCVPCCLLTASIQKRKVQIIFSLIGLILIAIILMLTGYFIGMLYKPYFSNNTLYLVSTIPKEYLNDSLYNLVLNYPVMPVCKKSLNRIQSTLGCCGIYSQRDFSKNNIKIARSCCPKSDCNLNKPFLGGCLSLIQEDIAWHRNIISSTSLALTVIYILNAILATSIYTSEVYKWRDIEKKSNNNKA